MSNRPALFVVMSSLLGHAANPDGVAPEKCPAYDDILLWFSKHPGILLFALREYLVFSLRLEPALHRVVNEKYDWDGYEVCVHLWANNPANDPANNERVPEMGNRYL